MDENRERVLRALSRIGAGAKHFAGLPFSLQLPAVAAVLLALSTFAPLYGDGPFPGQSWVAELDYNFGLLTLLVAIGCIALMVRLIRRQMTTDPGGLAALGLLAVITVGVEAIRIHDAPSASIGWGVYVSLGAAIALLLGGLLLLGGEQEPLPPPD